MLKEMRSHRQEDAYRTDKIEAHVTWPVPGYSGSWPEVTWLTKYTEYGHVFKFIVQCEYFDFSPPNPYPQAHLSSLARQAGKPQ